MYYWLFIMYCCACRWQCILSVFLPLLVYQYVLLCVRHVASEFTTILRNTKTFLGFVKTFFDIAFSVAAPRAWNRLPTELKLLVLLWYENISVSFCLWAPGYGLTLWCALSLLVSGAMQVSQLQLLAPRGAGAPPFPLVPSLPRLLPFFTFPFSRWL